MIEMKFSKDKPTLLLMKGRKKLGIFYIEDNWIHNFTDEVSEKIYDAIGGSKDDLDVIVSKCSSIEFDNVQVVDIAKGN